MMLAWMICCFVCKTKTKILKNPEKTKTPQKLTKKPMLYNEHILPKYPKKTPHQKRQKTNTVLLFSHFPSGGKKGTLFLSINQGKNEEI